MNKRNYLLMQAIAYGAIALFCLSLPLWAITDATGLYLSIALFLGFGFMAFKNFRQMKATEETEMQHAPSKDATNAEQASFYKRYLYISLAAFPLLTWIIVSDLNDLESGMVEQVSIWASIAFLYEQFGYWVATLSVPCLGLVVVFLFLRKLYLLKQ